MPGPTITETAEWSSITPPADGDQVAMTSGAAPTRSAIVQPLANRDRFIVSSLRGALLPTPPTVSFRYVGLFGPISAPLVTIVVSAFTLLLEDVTLSTPFQTVAVGPLAARTWHYLYAFDDGGLIGLEVSEIGPDIYSTWKSGGNTHRMIAAFPTDAAGVPIPFFRSGRTTQFTLSDLGVPNDLQVGASLTDTVWSTLDWRRPGTAMPLCPPFARALRMHVLASGGASGGTIELRPDSTARSIDGLYVGAGLTLSRELTIPIDSAVGVPSIQYRRDGVGSTVTADVTALGWEE